MITGVSLSSAYMATSRDTFRTLTYLQPEIRNNTCRDALLDRSSLH